MLSNMTKQLEETYEARCPYCNSDRDQLALVWQSTDAQGPSYGASESDIGSDLGSAPERSQRHFCRLCIEEYLVVEHDTVPDYVLPDYIL
jgi:hypothetical protein